LTEKQNGEVVDRVTSYFAMRTISLGKDEKGINRLLLNGKFVFQYGPLDQGFWPDGLYTAPTDEALKFDIEITKQYGFNMTGVISWGCSSGRTCPAAIDSSARMIQTFNAHPNQSRSSKLNG
jgi:hypothetical protein